MTTQANDLGADLRARRLAVGLSQEKLARLADCSTNTVCLVEKGYRPSDAMLGKLDHALNDAAEGR